MLRLETETGWWLVTHRDHARLAGAFAARWGNELFAGPGPRERVLDGIRVHDDGWVARDAAPQVTRAGKPSAFSVELVGKYSAFEEIDLADYLAVRERAVGLVAERDAYAALLVSMHTYNLLTERADRATIAAGELPLLDAFLERQRGLQARLFGEIQADLELTAEEKSRERIEDGFRLLQAVDNLSLLSCVAYEKPANLLHPLRLRDGGAAPVAVECVGLREFRLTPYPFESSPLVFEVAGRHVPGKIFAGGMGLQAAYTAAETVMLQVTVSS